MSSVTTNTMITQTEFIELKDRAHTKEKNIILLSLPILWDLRLYGIILKSRLPSDLTTMIYRSTIGTINPMKKEFTLRIVMSSKYSHSNYSKGIRQPLWSNQTQLFSQRRWHKNILILKMPSGK